VENGPVAIHSFGDRGFAPHEITMILYMQPQRTGARRAAVIGCALLMALGGWWLLLGTASPESTAPSSQAVSRATTPSAQQRHVPPPEAAAPPEPSPVTAAPAPLQYVGHWMEGSRRAVLLGYQGRNVVVRVPGSVDDRYEVVAADERQVVLRDRTTSSTLDIALTSAPHSSSVAAMARVQDRIPMPVAAEPAPPQAASMAQPDLGEPD